MYSKLEERWKKETTNQTGTVFLGKVNGTDEFLNVLYAPLAHEDKNKLTHYIFHAKSYDKKVLEQYLDFLAEHNGAVLYGGGVVLFGATDCNEMNPFLYPPSIVKANRTDYVSSRLNKVLYIGNALHKSGSNINFYLNLENGIISAYLKDEIVRSWKNINDFMDFIFETYNSKYGDDGLNKYYGMKNKNVYQNIQLFDEDLNG